MCIFFKVNVFTSDYFWAMWFQVGVLNSVLLQHSWLFTGINCWWNSEKRAAEWVVYFFDKQNIFRDKGANYKLKKGPLKSPHLMQSSFPSSFNEQLAIRHPYLYNSKPLWSLLSAKGLNWLQKILSYYLLDSRSLILPPFKWENLVVFGTLCLMFDDDDIPFCRVLKRRPEKHC